MSQNGYLILESGPSFEGQWHGGSARAGEVVFNTALSGYEEIATDPSYYYQIMVMTAPMQGNYGASNSFWESRDIWIQGLVCVEMQNTQGDSTWHDKLVNHGIPVLSEVDTRRLVLFLRQNGTTWGAVVPASTERGAREKAQPLIDQARNDDPDWVYAVTRKTAEEIEGRVSSGPRVAVLDYGCKENTIRELKSRCQSLCVFPSRTSAEEIREWRPDGILLSNGPGDPANVQQAADTVGELLGEYFIFGICMGHQILCQALGAQTYKLKFGHRGSNHPIKDWLLERVYMSSQNHGYAVTEESLPEATQVTHKNLNDGTVAGIWNKRKNCLSVQFHPESHPGPHDARELFDFFIEQIT